MDALKLKKKKQQNVVEYIIYIWHLQDLLRSMNFDLDLLHEKVLQSISNETEKYQALEEYKNFIKIMHDEGVKTKGNVSLVNEAIAEMNYLHNSLLTVFQDKDYMELYDSCKEVISELKNKSANAYLSPVEICLNGVYGVVILRLKQEKISEATADAVKKFSNLLNFIAAKYKDMSEGKPLFNNKINN